MNLYARRVTLPTVTPIVLQKRVGQLLNLITFTVVHVCLCVCVFLGGGKGCCS